MECINCSSSKRFVKVLIRQQGSEQGDRVVRSRGALCYFLGWPTGRSVRAASDLVLKWDGNENVLIGLE